MTSRARADFPSPPWDRVIAWAAAAVVAAFVIAAALTAIPPALLGRDARISDGRTPFRVGEAQIVVPAGWVVSGGRDGLVVRTPDGEMEARLEPADGAARAALHEALDAGVGTLPAATVGPIRSETLSTGLRAVHTDVGDAAVYAVVAAGDDARVRVVAEVREERERADYRAALAQLLAGVQNGTGTRSITGAGS